MLHYPDEVAEKIDEIERRAKRKKQAPMETAKALLAVEPNFGPGLLLMAMALEISGDSAQAEEVFWKALAQSPCRPEIYLYLGSLINRRRPDNPLGLRLKELAFWKLSMALTVRPDVVAFMRPILTELGSAADPYTYELLAKAAEAKFNETYGRAAAEEDSRFAPYQVLNDLEREAHVEVERETLRKVLDGSAEYAPLMHAALREWANTDPAFRTLDLAALRIFVAILGEIGEPQWIADLLELSEHPDVPTFRHIHWAIHRLGERYPAAALETFRAASRYGSTGMRCGLAEQLNLLPEMPGVTSALAALVDDFAKIAKDDDAPYLLAIATRSMAERGEVEAAHTILSRCQPLLPKDARAWLAETINGDEEFVPTLVQEEIATVDIEQVCLERIFMDDEEEDGGEEFEGDEDQEHGGLFDHALHEFKEDEIMGGAIGGTMGGTPEAALIPRAGRNDPCWCGSGKKYKKCHLRADEEGQRAGAEPESSPASGAGDPLTLRVFKGMSRWHSKADGMRARQMYFGSTKKVETDAEDMDGLVQFLLHDFRDAATRRTLLEHYLEDAASKLTALERTELESLRDARHGLYEMHGIEKGRGVHMRNVFSGESFFVEDITQSREASLWDCALVRVQFLDGRYVLAGNGTAVARQFLGDMKKFVLKESQAAGQSEAEFARTHSHWLRLHLLSLHQCGLENLKIVNREGDLVEFGTANYEVLDRTALLKKLRSLEELMEEDAEDSAKGSAKDSAKGSTKDSAKDSTARFAWLEAGSGPRSVYGQIEVSDRRLRLEASSRTRLELGRGLLEYNARPLLKHLGDSFKSVDELKRKVASGARPNQRTAVPPEVEHRVILEVKAQHYATWPDAKLPALKGITPRQAVRTKTGREAVLDLIRIMENGEARDARAGQPAFDFSPLRRELGLEKE